MMSVAHRAVGWCLVFGALALAPAVGIAQPAAASTVGYRIQASTIDGGTPVASTGGGYRLRGSIGQPDAGVLSANGYVLHGGFWPAAVARGDLIFANGFELNHDIIFADGFEANSASAFKLAGERP